MENEACALTVAQLAGHADGGWPDAGPQQHEARAQWIELGLVCPGARDLDPIGFRHRRGLCRMLLVRLPTKPGGAS